MNVLLLYIMICVLALALIDTVFSQHHNYPHENERFHFDECPTGSEIIRSSQGFPQKCLPRQLKVCYEAANLTMPTAGLAEKKPICCWNNKVDYYCCRGVAPENCPRYNDVTVVIRKGVPRPPPERLYAFRKIIPMYRSPFAGQQFVARQPLASSPWHRVVAPPPPFHQRIQQEYAPVENDRWQPVWANRAQRK